MTPNSTRRRFEKQIESESSFGIVACLYWIRKLQALVLAGDPAAALAASTKAERLLWMSPAIFERADYHFYSALALAALCDGASADDRTHHRQGLVGHHRRLEEWADHSAENFASRAALIGAEIARLEDRVVDAEHLYEKAIQSAHAHALGAACALALARSVASLLYGVGAADPATYFVTALGLGAAAMLASYGPARRAAKVDPLVTLRAE